VPPIDVAEVRVRIGTGGGKRILAARRGVTIDPMGMGVTPVIIAAAVAAAATITAVIDSGDLR
jgi:hypothetical protein